jgi:hypothetical protein
MTAVAGSALVGVGFVCFDFLHHVLGLRVLAPVIVSQTCQTRQNV